MPDSILGPFPISSGSCPADPLDPARPPQNLSWSDLVEALWKLGWIPAASLEEALSVTTPESLVIALKGYQGFNGLSMTGKSTPQVKRSLEGQRFCSLPDVMADSIGTLDRWPDPNIRYWIDPATLSGLPVLPDRVAAAIDWAWAQWAAVCGILPERVSDPGKAQVLVAFGPIDGAGKVLAESELADNSPLPKRQRFDSAEAWDFSGELKPYRVDLGRVACHEIGHVLGLPHLQSGNLMQPLYSLSVSTPQAGDAQEAVARYGPTVPGPLPPRSAAESQDSEFVVTISGSGALKSLRATGFVITPK